MSRENTYLLILFLPLLSSIVASVFGRYLGRKGSIFITVGSIFLTAGISTLTFYEVTLAESACYIQIATWIDCAMLHAS
jgi:NADH-quinone oxidoreductase subunit L